MSPLRRIGVIGDIHAEDLLLERALVALRAEGVDEILAVGDVVDGMGDVNRCIDLLGVHGVVCVRGNHDRWLLDDTLRGLPHAHRIADLSPASLQYLRLLPATRTFETAAGRLLLCHGIDGNDMNKVMPDEDDAWVAQNTPLQELIVRREIDVIVNGHSHRAMDRTIRGERGGRVRIINAGTLFREHGPCYALVDLVRGDVSFRPL